MQGNNGYQVQMIKFIQFPQRNVWAAFMVKTIKNKILIIIFLLNLLNHIWKLLYGFQR